MTINFLDNERVRGWLDQFRKEDRLNATLLLSVLKLVSADEFTSVMMDLLEKQIRPNSSPLALYNESERRHRNGRPHRLFRETSGKVLRAIGKSGPALVPRQRNVDEQIGSEGVVATILTQFHKLHRRGVLLSPGPDTIREKKVRRFVLVTDFIGSGERICDFLDAAWSVRSVRSWWSRRDTAGIKFDVVAFSGTSDGIMHVKNHPCQPQVQVSLVCPTIRTLFLPSQASIIEALCSDYVPKRLIAEALGYGQICALIGFSHSMPNNAPAILWKKFGKWIPLFPSRVTTGVGTPFVAGSGNEAGRKRLEATIGLRSTSGMAHPPTVEAIVLAALRRAPRSVEAVSGRLGLSLEMVKAALQKLQGLSWINDKNQITERGRLALTRLAKVEPTKLLPKSDPGYYYPKSLRDPRDV